MPPRLRRTPVHHPLDQACYPPAPGYYPEAHGHHTQRRAPDDHLLIYCRAGRDWPECADGHVEVGGDDLLVLPKGLKHAYGTDPQRPWSTYWVHSGGLLAEDFLRPPGNAPRLRLGIQPRLLAEFGALLVLRRQGLSLPHFIHAVHLLQGLLTSLAVRPAQTNLKSRQALDIDAMQALMRVHLHDSLNLDKLAAQSKLSHFYLAKTYHALTGQAPIQDFIQVKMTHIYRPLGEGALGIRQIIGQLDYADPCYFSRLFRKVVGMVPSHYQALHQGQCSRHDAASGPWAETDKDR